MNEHYDYCERNVADAAALLQDLKNGHLPTEQQITRRRRTGAIALRALYDELRRAFLTPIDREDLWQLCLAAQQVLFAVENTALTGSYHQQRILCSLIAACTQLRSAVSMFPQFRRDDAWLDHVFKAQMHLSEVRQSEKVVSTTCAALIDALLLAALKNE